MTRPDVRALQPTIDRYAADMRRAVIARLDYEAVRWLALLPQWTGPLALHCDFPAPRPLLQWLSEAQAAGMCRVQELPADGRDDEDDEGDDGDLPQIRFWMLEEERSEVLGDVSSRTELRALAAHIGERIQAVPPDLEREPGIERWADLAVRSLDDTRIGDWLIERVSERLQAGDTAEALDWLYAGEALAPVLGEEIISAAARAKRLVNIEYQRRLDDRFLKDFLDRPEQSEALDRLLSGRAGQPWALHFVGMGGVGKTMLIRFLGGPYAAAADPPVVTTKVDFDHISPRYPVERPGQLLRELASGLLGKLVRADQDSAYTHFSECADVLDRLTRTSAGRGGIESGEFETALEAFATLLRSFPPSVVLVLDTCEELAKLHPAGEPVPSIDRTFAILERLHEKVDGLRVVLAGRRLLAGVYANERLPDDAPRPSWAVSLAARNYMELFEIRGFDTQEARTFLRRVREGRPPMPPDIENAVLEATLDSGRVTGLAMTENSREHRYNPYELGLYADWFDETAATLTAADIASDGLDGYVESRIVRRVPSNPPVNLTLPYLAGLGRIDIHLLRAVLDLPGADADRLFRTLAEQEWIGTRAAQESGVTVVEIQAAILHRLRAWFARPEHRHVRDAAEQRLRSVLPALIRGRPLDAAAVEHVSVALGILPAPEAAMLWDEIVVRIQREDCWRWAEEACARLLANDADAATPRAELEAAVRVVHIGAVRRRDPAWDPSEEWRFVAAVADRHPREATARSLADRAALGRAAAAAHADGPDDPAESAWRAAWGRVLADVDDRERSAAAFATVEALLDAGCDEHQLPPLAGADVLADWASAQAPSRFAACAQFVMARWQMRAGQAREIALGPPEVLSNPSVDPGSVDWLLPVNARDRLRLQWLHATVGHPESTPSNEVLREWLDVACAGDDVDAERLASAVLLRMLGRNVVAPEIVLVADTATRRLPQAPPVCPAHVETPPLLVAAVRAWLALGDPEAANELIEYRYLKNSTGPVDIVTAVQNELVVADLVRRMRWLPPGSAIISLNEGSQPRRHPDQLFAVAAIQTLLGQPQLGTAEDDGTPRAADRLWRTAVVLDSSAAHDLLGRLAKRLVPADDPVVTAHCLLDKREAALVRRRFRVFGSADESDRDQNDIVLSRAEEDIAHRLERGAGSLRLVRELRAIRLRQWAFGNTPPSEWQAPDDAPHDWARTAVEEGELLALRQPRMGARLLGLAQRLFDDTQDVPGTVTASTLAVIARYHADEAIDAGAALTNTGNSYERLRAVAKSPLPSWSQLGERVEPDRSEAVGPWGAWLNRLATCRARQNNVSLEPVPAAELNLTVPRSYSRLLRTPGYTLGYIVGVLFVLGFYGFVGNWLGGLVWEPLGWHPPLLVGLLAGLAVSMIVILGVVMLGPAASALLERLRVDEVVDVHPERGRKQALLTVRLARRQRSRAWSGILSVFLLSHVLTVLLAVRRAAGSVVLDLAPDPLRTSLPRRLRLQHALAGRLSTRLVVRVGPEAASGAWEALLTRDRVAGSKLRPDDDFTVVREFPVRTSHGIHRPFSSAAAVVCAPAFALMVEDGWKDARLPFRILNRSRIGALYNWTPGVIHVIGSPVPGELGAKLKVEGATLRPELFAVPGVQLIILQAEPTRSSVSSDPRSALLRAAAHDAAAASGGAGVLTIPTLPGHVATILIAEIARVVDSETLDRETLVTLAQRLRGMVYDATQEGAAVAARCLPAFDVCLYVGV